MSYSEIDRQGPKAKIPPASGPPRVCLVQCPKIFPVVAVLLILCFARPLWDLARLAWHSELYGHILLMPFISVYLVWSNPKRLFTSTFSSDESSDAEASSFPKDLEDAMADKEGRGLPRQVESSGRRGLAVIPFLAGLGMLVGYWMGVGTGWNPKMEDYLAVMTSSFLLFLVAGGLMLMGVGTLRRLAFPAALLIFMVPFPSVVLEGIETFLQRSSADCAYLLFQVSGMPVLREGTVLHLPGFSMQVAPECSGIHSTLVLFITSFLGGHLLLRSTWSRAVLVLAVIPLALVRNGIRILTIGQLCVRVSPEMINSYIHRRGGPIFFAASLVPFLGLLMLLRKLETRRINHRGTKVQR